MSDIIKLKSTASLELLLSVIQWGHTYEKGYIPLSSVTGRVSIILPNSTVPLKQAKWGSLPSYVKYVMVSPAKVQMKDLDYENQEDSHRLDNDYWLFSSIPSDWENGTSIGIRLDKSRLLLFLVISGGKWYLSGDIPKESVLNRILARKLISSEDDHFDNKTMLRMSINESIKRFNELVIDE